jgi:uncharacterized membrane protein YeaQ/YmgE (transglycosylase-associated protein family)
MFWMGSPSIAPRPAFVLAQTAPSFQIPVEQQPASRLDSLSITAIQNRILIDPAVQRYVAAKAAYAASKPRGFRGAPIPIDSALVPLYAAAEPSLTEDEKTILTAIQANPTDDEIADLALIDGFFRAADAPKFVNANPDLPLTEGVCAALNPQGYGLHGLGMVAWGAKPLTQGGAIAGWLAGLIVRGAGFGLIGNIVIGIIGALVASWLLPQLGVSLGGSAVRDIVNATIGAVIILVILSLVRRA